MKKFSRILFGLAVIIVAFQACRKDKTVKNQPEAFNPTYIDPKTIFPAQYGMPNLPADNPLTVEGVYLGRMLFYDPVLSFDSSISCASCHDQKHAFADPRKLSIGIFGNKTGRNAPPIFNLAYQHNFFWDARQHTLREQLLEPIQSHVEMGMTLPFLETRLKRNPLYITWFKKAFNATPDVFNMAKAIEQFELTIVSSNSLFNRFFPGKFSLLSFDEGAGANLFNHIFDTTENPRTGTDCFHCHGQAFAQNNADNNGGLANNGLDVAPTDLGYGGITGRKSDMGVFKTPSLLNIAVTSPYMHDGRFNTLEEVIDQYSDNVHYNSPNIHPSMSAHAPARLHLTPLQKAQLKAYLLTMTDNDLLNNPDYSNPFH